MSNQSEQRQKHIRWTTLRKLITVILFMGIVAFVEYVIVLSALDLGLRDQSVLQWDIGFPGTGWSAILPISPLLYLVPICVIITLTFSWIYLAKRFAVKRQEIRKGKVEVIRKMEKGGIFSGIERAAKNFSRRLKMNLLKLKGISYVSKRIVFARSAIKSAVIVLTSFIMFTLLFLLFAYPQLIYRTITNAYATNPSFFGFVSSISNWVKGAAEALGPIGWIGASINNGLVAAAPVVRGAGGELGNLLKPIATLDNAGKYLVFQNAAAWISAMIIFVHAEQAAKGHRFRK